MYELTSFRNMNNVRSGDFILHLEIFQIFICLQQLFWSVILLVSGVFKNFSNINNTNYFHTKVPS